MAVGVEGRSRGTDGKILPVPAVSPLVARGLDVLVTSRASVDSRGAGVRGGDGLTDSSSKIRCNCAAASSSSFADDVVEARFKCLPLSSCIRSKPGSLGVSSDGLFSPFLS